jgi:hypothetical protein
MMRRMAVEHKEHWAPAVAHKAWSLLMNSRRRTKDSRDIDELKRAALETMARSSFTPSLRS